MDGYLTHADAYALTDLWTNKQTQTQTQNDQQTDRQTQTHRHTDTHTHTHTHNTELRRMYRDGSFVEAARRERNGKKKAIAL